VRYERAIERIGELEAEIERLRWLLAQVTECGCIECRMAARAALEVNK
jgi:hypothetical protein